MGCIMFALVTGHSPFPGGSFKSIRKLQGTKGFHVPWEKYPMQTDTRRFLELMIEKDHKKRLSAKEVLEHPLALRYFAKYNINLEKLRRELEIPFFEPDEGYIR